MCVPLPPTTPVVLLTLGRAVYGRLTVSDFYEQDEIMKLRQAALKKEDTDLQVDLEKLEQERNLHIREFKRIHAEDSSRSGTLCCLSLANLTTSRAGVFN